MIDWEKSSTKKFNKFMSDCKKLSEPIYEYIIKKSDYESNSDQTIFLNMMSDFVHCLRPEEYNKVRILNTKSEIMNRAYYNYLLYYIHTNKEYLEKVSVL